MTSSTATSTSSVIFTKHEVVRRDVPAVRAARCSTNSSQPASRCRPGTSSRTIGAGGALPVCTSVSSSNASSIVPKPPGSSTNAVRLLHERDLAGEEVPEVDELRVVGEELASSPPRTAAGCSRRTRSSAPGALDAGFHDPGTGAGDDHPVALGQSRREPAGLVVERVVAAWCGPSRRSRPCVPTGTARTRGTRGASP